jgi:hypothetical protein
MGYSLKKKKNAKENQRIGTYKSAIKKINDIFIFFSWDMFSRQIDPWGRMIMIKSARAFITPAEMLRSFALIQRPVVSHGVQNFSLGLHKNISIKVTVR